MWCCCGTEQPLRQWWRLWLPLLLLNVVFTQGVIHETSSLQEVGTIQDDLTRLCVEAQEPGGKMELLLQVGEPGEEQTSSIVVVRRKWLPVGEPHTLTVKHSTKRNRKHQMQVLLDERELPYDEDSAIGMLAPAKQWKISLYVKGKIKLEVCPGEESETLRPSTSILPAAVEMTDPTAIPTAVLRTTARTASLTLLDGRKEEEEELFPREDSGTGAITTTSSTNTIAIVNTTTDAPGSSEGEEWWSFIMVLGHVGGVPVLALLLLCLIVGVLMGVLMTFLCVRRRKNELHYRRVRRSLPRSSDHVDVILNARSFCSDKKSSTDLGTMASGRPTISLNPSFASVDHRSNSIHSRISNMNDLNLNSKNSSCNNSIDSNYLRANFPSLQPKNGLGYTPSQKSNDDNTCGSSTLNISSPLIDGVYSLPHETETELVPLKTGKISKYNYDDLQNKQFGTFRQMRS